MSMMLHMVFSPLALLEELALLFLAGLPLIALDGRLKARRMLRGGLSFREQRSVERLFAEMQEGKQRGL